MRRITAHPEDRSVDRVPSALSHTRGNVKVLTVFATIHERDRRRYGVGVWRAAWLFGVTVHECGEIEAGAFPTSKTYERMCDPFGGRERRWIG
jgi:hypothetical protein